MTELEMINAIDCMAEEILHNMIKNGSSDSAIEEALRDRVQYYWARKMESLTEEAYDGFAFIESVYDTALDRFMFRTEVE